MGDGCEVLTVRPVKWTGSPIWWHWCEISGCWS